MSMPIATIGAKNRLQALGFGFSMPSWSDVTDVTDTIGDFGSDMIDSAIDMDIPVISPIVQGGRAAYDFGGEMGDVVKRNTGWFTSDSAYDGSSSEEAAAAPATSSVNWLLVGGIGIAAFLLLK